MRVCVHPLDRFWRFIDGRSESGAVIAEWQSECDGCFEYIRPLLRPNGRKASIYPSARSGHPPLRVVEHDDGRIVAICDRGMSPRTNLTAADISIHVVPPGSLRGAIAGALQLRVSRGPLPSSLDLIDVGTWCPQPASRFPVVFLGNGVRDDRHLLLHETLERSKRPHLVLVPCQESMDGSLSEVAEKFKATIVPLEGVITGGWPWRASPEWAVYLDGFCKRAGVKFPSSFTNRGARRRRASRANAADALKVELHRHLRDARKVVRAGGPLPDRPTQQALARTLGLSESQVSRCLNDGREPELRLLWERSLDSEQVYHYRR